MKTKVAVVGYGSRTEAIKQALQQIEGIVVVPFDPEIHDFSRTHSLEKIVPKPIVVKQDTTFKKSQSKYHK